ncbi:MAG: thiolase domain-containing protein [Chloroflexi bacterium]|nr:thiolase domain-containing protein [Chloroflexota bacterium]
MREVAIVGIGQTPVGEHWDRSLRDLSVQAILDALDDAHIARADALYIGNMLSGELASQEHLGALVADHLGLAGMEAIKIEAACGSGGAAVRSGALAVASGQQDVVIAAGVEKMTEMSSNCTTRYLASAADGDYEAAQGFSFVAINALIMQRYMYEHGLHKEDFAPFAVNAHANAVGNPHAMFRRPITEAQFRAAKPICAPITLLDSSPMADGAAAVILCPLDRAREFSERPIRIAASALATDTVALHDRRDVLFLQAGYESARRAYRQAGVGPDDIDLFELHDAFTIMAALSLEATGFAERGQGVRLAQEGEITRRGRIPICTMGGLKGRGHPVGATGVYQIVEAVQQLRGQAGDNQIEARRAMTQNIGGSGATIVTHILETMD